MVKGIALVLVVALASSAAAEPWPTGLAIAAEGAGGVAGGLVVGAGVGVVTALAMVASNRAAVADQDEMWFMLPVAVGGFAGYPVGSALGV